MLYNLVFVLCLPTLSWSGAPNGIKGVELGMNWNEIKSVPFKKAVSNAKPAQKKCGRLFYRDTIDDAQFTIEVEKNIVSLIIYKRSLAENSVFSVIKKSFIEKYGKPNAFKDQFDKELEFINEKGNKVVVEVSGSIDEYSITFTHKDWDSLDKQTDDCIEAEYARNTSIVIPD